MSSLRETWTSLASEGGTRVFVLLDAAGFEEGRSALPLDCFMKVECLFTGDLAEELRDVAPYLCEVGLESAQIEPQLELILATQVGMLVVPRERDTEFGVVYRHFRKFNVVYGPEGNPLFFRYYDPRVLEDVLRVLDASQLEAFFGPVDSLMLMNAEGEVRRLQQRGGSLEVR